MATKAERFDAAFINARKRGAKTFTFEGKKYSTKTAEEEIGGGEDERLGEWDAEKHPYTKGWDYMEYVMKERQKPDRGMDMSRGARLRADAGIKALDAANNQRKRKKK